ncbi:MAG: FHA domain-containing protein, partial [Anaerolineales bacterium]
HSDKTAPPYPITSPETVIGKRQGAVQYLIDDPSVDALHARLIRLENGRFRLYDNGSLYGTWVNYTPISREGTNLEDGDLIHIGKVGFRFKIT